jgi:hypothetical protein
MIPAYADWKALCETDPALVAWACLEALKEET